MESKRKSEVFAAVVSSDVPLVITEEKDDKKRNLAYIPFGSDNYYPQALAALYRKSVGLRGIIQSKVTFIVSGGFHIDEANNVALEFLDNPNNKEESLDDIFENYLTDRYFSGNSYLEIVTDAKKSFISIFHVQSVKCRLSKEKDSILIHPNWGNYKKGDKLTKEVALYPKFTNDKRLRRSIVHVKDYEPDFDNYGIPSFISALDAAAIGYKTNKWNVSRLDNSFQSSGVLVIDGQMSAEDAKQLKKEFKEEMLGEGNQGKVLMIIKKLGGEGTEYTPINSNSEGDWMELHNQSDNDLIIANGWKKSLVGISENSGFDVDRILNDYQILKNTIIFKEQNRFIKLITKIVKDYNIDLEGLNIINLPPVSLLTKLDANKFTKIWEARREAGNEYDSEDVEQNKYIDSTPSTQEKKTESAIQSLSKMIKEFKAKLKL